MSVESRGPASPMAVLRPRNNRLTLHLGVVVQPYRAPNGTVTPVTTGDVAEWLENRYGIMAAFYRFRRDEVSAELMNSIEGSLESLLMGQVVDTWGPAVQAIRQMFRDFINLKQVESVGIPHVPTYAAVMGVNHRLKHPYAKRNPRRPSFRDTGLYVNSFRAWVD